MSPKHQAGYFAILAIIFIVIIGFLGLTIVYMFSSGATISSNFVQAAKAFYIAEGGLEKTTRYLLTPVLSGTASRIACANINGNSNLTNSSLGNGSFTITEVTGSPFFAATTLSSAITATATTITVANTTGFATNGRILIDNEAIDYAALSGNNFIGLTRGMNNTLASSHVSGTYVSQYQCSVNSQGSIPNTTAPINTRNLQQSIQLQDAWAGGAAAGSLFVFTHWNRPTELGWTNSSLTNATYNDIINGISLLSYAEGWAVANEENSRYNILKLSGNTWASTPYAGTCPVTLNAVSAVSARNVWAVGVRNRTFSCSFGNYRYTVLYWNGTTWTTLSSATSPSIPADGSSTTIQDLNSIHVIDTNGDGIGNFGFAVGNAGRILQFNGSAWSAVSSPYTSDYESVYVVSASEAWAVGTSGRIIRWNGSSWSAVSSPTSTTLNSISMVDTNGDGVAEAGWAVGASGIAIRYNGSTWSSQNAGGSTLYSVFAFDADDAWAVGTSGRVTHWDGNTWTNGTSNVTTDLRAISGVRPKHAPFSAWKEVFS